MKGSGEGSQVKRKINPSIRDLWYWKHQKMNSFVRHNNSLPGGIIILKLVWPQSQSLFNCIYFWLIILFASLRNLKSTFSLILSFFLLFPPPPPSSSFFFFVNSKDLLISEWSLCRVPVFLLPYFSMYYWSSPLITHFLVFSLISIYDLSVY